MLQDQMTPDQFVAALEASELAKLDKLLTDAKKTAVKVEQLDAAGFCITYLIDYPNSAYLHTTKQTLPKIRTILCMKLRHESTWPEKSDTVRVTLNCDAAPCLRIEYVDKIKKDGKCHIEPEYIKHYKIVCKK